MAFAAPKLKSRLIGYSLDLQAKRLLAGRAQPEIARSLSAACRRGQQMDSSASTGDTLESCSTIRGQPVDTTASVSAPYGGSSPPVSGPQAVALHQYRTHIRISIALALSDRQYYRVNDQA